MRQQPRKPARDRGAIVAAVTAMLLLVTTPLAYPQGSRSHQRFEDATEVILVQIPVYAIKNGEPVRGLTADNFEVLEGRKKQPVVALDVYDLAILASPEDGSATGIILPPSGRRNFVMLFDLSNSLPAGIVRARQAAMEMARNLPFRPRGGRHLFQEQGPRSPDGLQHRQGPARGGARQSGARAALRTD